ncbi:MAG: CPBP family intramembrane glutamic endopeptidase [Lentisphaeria bacterium]|nr:CPBP family intramembrane glutamic endopeptidase [Lentisphaeria bacterium]
MNVPTISSSSHAWIRSAFPPALVATVLGGVVIGAVMPAGVKAPSLLLLTAGLLPLHGIGLGVFLLLARKARGAGLWRDVGLRRLSRRGVISQFFLAVPIAFFILVMGLLMSQVCVIMLDIFGLSSTPPDLFDFMNPGRPVLAAAAFFTVIVWAPVSEEILFRFGCFEFLQSWHIPGPALWVGGLFALIHGQLFAVPTLFFLSLVLQTARVRGKGLWLPIFIHGFFNLFASLLFIVEKAVNNG